MTLYLCTRSDEQYPRGCIYDYLILPVKKNAKFLTPSSTDHLRLPLERMAFSTFASFSFFFSPFSSFFLSSHLLRYYSYDENEKSHMNRL